MMKNDQTGRLFFRRLAIFLLLIVIGTGIDLGSKRVVFDWLGFPSGRIHWLIPGLLGFQTSLNEGALFGLGAGQIPFFVIVSIFALFGVAAWFLYDAWKGRTTTIALGLIVAGILGNLWDRLALHGLVWPEGIPGAGEPVYAVRDWILVLIGSYHWPNFNVADSCLVIGTTLMILYLLFSPSKESASAGKGTGGSKRMGEPEGEEGEES